MRYNEAVNNAIQNVTNVAQQAQASVEDRMDENTARAQYPEIFSDPELEKDIAARWLFDRTSGRNTSVVEICKQYSERQGRAKQVEQAVASKEQASLGVQTQTSQPARQAQSAEDLENLKVRTRLGDDNAIYERLRKIPPVN